MTTSLLSRRQSAVYLAGQKHTECNGRRRSYRQGRAGIFCSGAGGTDFFLGTDLNTMAVSARDVFEVLCTEGYQFACPDTLYTWLNNTAMARMDSLYTYLTGTLGYPSKLLLIGGSQGGGTALLWAKRNPEKVAGIVGLVPLTHLDAFHDENRGGFAVSIETAYGGLAAYNTAVPTHDPAALTTEIAALGIPIHLFYSEDDNLIGVAETQAFATAVGADITSIGTGGAHSINKLDPELVIRWVEREVVG